MRDLLRRLLWEQEQIIIPIIELSHGSQPKEDRVKELIGIDSDGRLLIQGDQKRLKEQRYNFPSQKGGIDALDALAHLNRMTTIPKLKKEKTTTPVDSVDRDIEMYLVRQKREKQGEAYRHRQQFYGNRYILLRRSANGY